MLFFDNILFKQHFPTEHAEVAQNRTLGYICEALEKIHNIVDSTYSLNEYEKSVAELSLDFLNSSLSNDD